ncbi:adenosylcobinamide-phosphate synthase CbiB [Sphingomonas montanisoli]|uniref:Cobalamin biosynthesis protein CobD n=1 Tax=Sphingomonas montanisoli TaxID=2606412 RepID=A0A5D9C2I6_9SPHN|nr:adenosylcobinamide-phosphate synthase CbiB [Sphingomonas montanisoli]TZG25944.1 cobalamin biosynthesis protein CobD [Sphingomonas montanisoli]
MFEPLALGALILDAGIGWPAGLYRRIGHPVGAFAAIIGVCERHWNRPDISESGRRVAGVATVLLLIAVAGGAGWALQALAMRLPFGWVIVALLAFPALAQRSLFDHVRPVARALAAGDLEGARRAVGMIVGRDTAQLDEAGVARAGIESLAESFCDGIAAPLFWLLLLGLPGVWAYKAINTADSLIGHKEERWRAFGWAAARTDDVLNLIPARIAGVMICLAGPGGWRVMLRDAGKHASPNAGWPEAAMAGVLGVRLAGPIAYDNVVVDKAWIGNGRADANADDLHRALAIYVRACLMLWVIAGVCA